MDGHIQNLTGNCNLTENIVIFLLLKERKKERERRRRIAEERKVEFQ